MGTGSSSGTGAHTRIIEVLKQTPFMRMMDDKSLGEIAACFQLVKYPKGAAIKNEPWLFFIVAEGSVDISSLIPTGSRKQHLHEVLCQRKVGDYISFAARDLLLGRLMDESAARARRSTVKGPTPRLARKNLMAMLDLNRITADMFTGCTLLKLHRDRFLKLRSRLESRRSSRNDLINHTRRFSDDESHSLGVSKAGIPRRNTLMTGPERMNLLNSVVESDIVNFLFDIPFLEGVDQSRLVTLSNLSSYEFIRKGAVLCQEGEIGDRFFICIRGALQATVQAVSRHNKSSDTSDQSRPVLARGNSKRCQGDRKIHSLKRMGPGTYFGEISLLFRIPRICSITAIEDSLLVYIDRVAFCNFLKIVPEAKLVLLEHVRLNFIDTLIKQGSTFLNAMPVMKRQELSHIGDIVEHTTGEMVVEKGANHSGFYILLRGQVEVEYFPLKRSSVIKKVAISDNDDDDTASTSSAPSPREVIRIQPGGYFGHEAIILGESSPVTVRCVDHSLALRLSTEVFREFFSSAPALYAEFCIKCLRDKSRPEHIMQHYDAHHLWAADCINRRRQHELMLFESIEDFMWEADLSEENTNELALMVYMRYLADNAPLHVHISSSVLDKIEDDLASQQAERDIFDGARNEILMRMEDANFEAFKSGENFQDFLGRLHCPQSIYDGLTTRHLARLDMTHTSPPGDESRRPRMKLEDVEEEIAREFETRSKIVNTGIAGGVAISSKSFGRAASQRRYLVATANAPQALGASVGRRKSRIDTMGLQRVSSAVSSTFVF